MMISLDVLKELVDDPRLDARTTALLAEIVDQWSGHDDPAAEDRSVKRLLWYGHPDQTVVASRRLPQVGGDTAISRDLTDWAACLYPGLFPRSSSDSIEVASGLEGVPVLAGLLAGDDPGRSVIRAEQVLRSCPMGAPALESLVAALTTLLYADRADLAVRWCEPLLEQTSTQCDPTWLGIFAAIRAETALRQGRFRAAEQCAHAALTHIPLAGWGVTLGFPLACMVTAKTAMGKHEDGLRYLAVPVPEAMYQTPVGPHYLMARARHLMATGATEAALADFQASGDLIAQWNLELPGIAAWRLGAAQALVHLGRAGEAATLLKRQIALLGGARHRVRGIALRLRASTLAAGARPAVLEAAIDILRTVDDRAELALALSDLSAAYSAVGQAQLARSMKRRARQLAMTSGIGPPADAPSMRPEPISEPVVADGDAELSDAEERVATLAAQGYTNREIAAQLYITVSTVEQHLTRSYRKLGVSRRVDLPMLLG